MSNGTKHKLYNYEVTPPRGVWEKIAEALDESDLGKEYPVRLYEMEVAPPATAWSAIAAQLDPASTTVTKRRLLTPLLRYAAAAAIIGMLAWGGIRLLNRSKTVAPPTARTTAPDQRDRVIPSTNPVVKTGEEKKVVQPVVTDEERNDRALEESKKTYAVHVPVRSKIHNANTSGFHFTIDNIEPSDLNPATRYIVLMKPDGSIIRMSKKWSDLVCCVSGAEQDKDCEDQMKRWREKLASPSLANSPGNFGDILNLVKSLQE